MMGSQREKNKSYKWRVVALLLLGNAALQAEPDNQEKVSENVLRPTAPSSFSLQEDCPPNMHVTLGPCGNFLAGGQPLSAFLNLPTFFKNHFKLDLSSPDEAIPLSDLPFHFIPLASEETSSTLSNSAQTQSAFTSTQPLALSDRTASHFVSFAAPPRQFLLPSNPRATTDSYIQDGVKYAQTGRLNEAIECFQTVRFRLNSEQSCDPRRKYVNEDRLGALYKDRFIQSSSRLDYQNALEIYNFFTTTTFLHCQSGYFFYERVGLHFEKYQKDKDLLNTSAIQKIIQKDLQHAAGHYEQYDPFLIQRFLMLNWLFYSSAAYHVDPAEKKAFLDKSNAMYTRLQTLKQQLEGVGLKETSKNSILLAHKEARGFF